MVSTLNMEHFIACPSTYILILSCNGTPPLLHPGAPEKGKGKDISEFPLREIISEESWKLVVVTVLHYNIMRSGAANRTQLSQWILKIELSQLNEAVCKSY